ncbi:MAG: tripartite tricarboxylate transporter substrate binding protein [Betaproteobacteria bacterium]|nr:tripartite tricarboxylate transporter substrate binding protein [Betaproteobacteria bacterium]
MVALALPAAACAQGWKPEKTVEFVIGGGAGGGTDITARVVQKILQDLKLVPNSVVVNRPGAGHTVAWAWLNQNIGDGHYISIVNELFFINRIVGRSPLSYRDFTPLTVLFNEYLVFLVKPDSPIKTAKDFLAQLKKDPTSLSIGFSAARGNNSHLSIGLAAKAARADLKQLNTPVFKSGGEALTALLGGHIDVGVTPIAPSISHILAGRLRVLAVTSSQRMGGPLANVPTWKEQGADFTYGSWRVAFGPRDIGQAQIAFWEEAFRRVIDAEDWRKEVAKNHQGTGFRSAGDTRRFLEAEEARLRPILGELGLVKQ